MGQWDNLHLEEKIKKDWIADFAYKALVFNIIDIFSCLVKRIILNYYSN